MSTDTLAPRAARLRAALSRGEWLSLGGMAGFVLLLHVVGWGLLVAVIAPHHYQVGANQVFGVGLGVTAYTLGMRHAFDADHIAAIDNTTRKLMTDGKRPLSVGFWFSLGHSSIVFGLCGLLALGVRALAGQVESDGSRLHDITGLIGTSVSGVFLFLIGIINLVVLVGIARVFRAMRQGEYDEAALEEQLNSRGFMNRILGGATRAVTKPWQMYPIGLLFGLGFDTATEVSLLVLAGGAAAFSLPWYAILVLPVLFAAGMSLLDSVDGCFMNFAYGWAFSKPVRKVYYNLTITALSVAVALIIGTVELVSILTEKAHITSGPLAWMGSLDLNYVGYAIVALFVLTWVVALLVWRLARIEDKWTAGLAEAGLQVHEHTHSHGGVEHSHSHPGGHHHDGVDVTEAAYNEDRSEGRPFAD
jgi:nickel/cobalt transporter (NiCoT) family protein